MKKLFSLIICWFAFVSGDYSSLPIIHCQGSHYEYGHCVGENTASLIERRYNASLHFQSLYNWTSSGNGSEILDLFVKNNLERYPEFMDEIQGISDGSKIELRIILVMTLDDELSYFAPNTSVVDMNYMNDTIYNYPDSCSDYMLHIYPNQTNNNDVAYLAHNEDNLPENLNVTFLVISEIDDSPAFICYSYAGELPSQAFGWNNYIMYSSNYVDPSNPVLGGIGRNFIGRDLLRKTSLSDALKTVTQDGQCGGHNYQILEWKTFNMTDAEVAYDALNQLTFVTSETNWLFHANRYIHLNISQQHDDDYVSSEHREARAAELGPPSNLDDMLNDLGDTEDEEYPIYKYGPNDYTLHTIGVDVANCYVTIYTDNPIKRIELYHTKVNCQTPIFF